MKKRLLTLALAVILVFSLVPAAFAAHDPAVSSNADAQSYHDAAAHWYTRWASPIRSYLCAAEDGMERLEYLQLEDGTMGITVERYDFDGVLQSRKSVPMELPLFGGFLAGTDANYLVFGQTNAAGSDEAEVLRVVQYDKDWKRVGSVSITGENTTTPFRAGTLRMAEDANYLYVHTCHEMYAVSGVNHQANLTFVVRKRDLKVTDVRSGILNESFGYASHSFNQFIAVDGERVVTVDQGDASPRSIFLYRMERPGADGKCLPGYDKDIAGEGLDLLFFRASTTHQNATGANLGGFVVSPTHYLVVGSSVDQSKYGTDLDKAQRNIFVCAASKDALSAQQTTFTWLTSHAGDEVQPVSVPRLVALDGGGALVLWTEGETLYYRFLRADGTPADKVYSDTGALSDCQPVLIDGLVRWYVTTNGVPTFYAIAPAKPDKVEKTEAAGMVIPFEDVPRDEYYCDAVLWAVKHDPQITNGTSKTKFSPNSACTRSQVVTFLWRAMGEPEPTATDNPFTDIKDTEYYYKAVLWAVEKGITKGTSEKKFSPDAGCTRAQVVTFLYRAHEEPAVEVDPEAAPPFADVAADSYYNNAVLWAVEQGITTGTSAGRFSPDATCTRGQIVTFLHRDLAAE